MHGMPARRMSRVPLKPDVNRTVRSFAFIACLSAKADPFCALGPT